MSAFVVYLDGGDSAAVATDGGAFSATGRMRGTAPKAFLYPVMPAVIACRGPLVVAQAFAKAVELNAPNFDQLVDDCAGLYVYALARTGFFLRSLAGKDLFQAVFAGYSQRAGRVEAFTMHSHAREELAGLGPHLTANRLDRDGKGCAMLAPCDEHLQRRVAASGIDLWAEPTSIPEHALGVMREQRTTPLDANTPPMVGGYCQLTTVTRDSLHTTILEFWNGK